MQDANPPGTDRSLQDIHIEINADGIATVWIDAAGKSVNTLTPLMLQELAHALSRLEARLPKGVIFASAKARSFVAGADLFALRQMKRQQVEAFLATGQRIFNSIADLACPTVAAINGDCLGGGLELALACKYRVAADTGSISIGLPEVKLGIIPGWGGTVRLPRLIGLSAALPLLSAGKTFSPAKARQTGIVDETVPVEALREEARQWALDSAKARAVVRVEHFTPESRSDADRILSDARSKVAARSQGHDPAALRLIEVVGAGIERGPAAGFEAERGALCDLRDGEVSQNLMRLFFLRQGAKKTLAQRISAKPKEVKHVAVLGGGTMGAGIIHGLACAGIAVRLIEVSPAAVDSAMKRIRKLLDDDIAAGKRSAPEAQQAADRITPAAEWTNLGSMDVVIEAVVEEMEAKRQVFAKLDQAVGDNCVLATNTSSLSVGEMAQATAQPNRVVGLHFFNPVPRMPLVEVVRAPRSDDQSLATAAALAIRMGKTPVLVNDGPGFVVNRVLMPYLAEAMTVAAEHTPITTIDQAMERWGMPMGPIALLDEIGLDVSALILKSLASRIKQRIPHVPILGDALKHGWLGKKSGAGFYIYRGDKKRGAPEINGELSFMPAGSETAGQTPPATDEQLDEIAWRLLLPMANEAVRLLDEQVVDSVDDVDLATVLGAGVAPFRGGLAHFIDSVGMENLKVRLKSAAAKFGSRFEPAPLIERLAARHQPLSSLAPSR